MEIEFDENSPVHGVVKGKISKTLAGARATQPLGPSSIQNTTGANGKAIEEIYQKKSQLEHILLRPDTYIGSTEKQQVTLWVFDGERMVNKTITYAPGLYKIFDEILVNAADNKVRDPSMDTLKVDIVPEEKTIKVWNNGNGVPVEIHKEENVYVPELIFGHLLTSSNYDDNEKKITGGRNGYGAKLANIFSTEFVIETCDGQRQRRYRQVFKNNMGVKGKPAIHPCKPTDNWTCVTFKPDLTKFDMTELEDDVVQLMRKRVYDMAGILGKGVKVFLNGQRLSIKSFQDYVDMYLGPKDTGVPRIYERINDRWELAVSLTDGQFQQVSFCNAICTSKGGTHVNYVVDQLSKGLVEKINKKHKSANVKPFMVKNHLWVFVNSLVENPAFDSQTKETLTLKASSFGSKCELSTQFVDKVGKCGIIDNILSYATFKNNKDLKKSDGAKRSRLTGIPKLDDANDAGGRNSDKCTLILTEGDSAKTLAISGLSVVGRDQYGVFPLRGKLLNVRDATATQINDNAEISNIKQILGLQHGKAYEDVKQLRYGSLMIMTDQDHDGSHIKGLIMNFLHSFYPSLLQIPGFLVEFITPIVKASRGSTTHTFYTMPEYEAWKESLNGNTRGWQIKYYKGLGTSTSKEAKEYFAAIGHHRKEFVWEGLGDGEAIEMAFSKKKVDDRKRWLSNFVPGTFLDHATGHISYSDFIHKELILFSRADLERSIPSMLDGLKPGQRKILFCCFKRNIVKDIKVAQLAGFVAADSAYHHGEASLQQTITGLAQDFVGSNNINLLFPSGQFGTRLQGGKDSASPRYIYTRLAGLTRYLFHESDDKLLNYLNEEGQSIEPEWYLPILPTVLVNGAEGIGTGWSTYIPNYNPRDIVNNLLRLLSGEPQEPMTPWYRGFKGAIQEVPGKTSGKSYNCNGIINQVDDVSLVITELPVRKWTQDYKEFLESLIKPKEKTEQPLLVEYKEHHTDVTVDFRLEVLPDKMAECLAGGLEAKFKLTTKFSTGNMMLFDSEGKIKRYDSPEEVVQEFYTIRLEHYEKRRTFLLKAAEAELVKLDNKVRFILAVISGEMVVSNRKKADIEMDLEGQGYPRLQKSSGKSKKAEEEEEEESPTSPSGGSYDYLLSMPIYSLTFEKVQQLREEAEAQAHEVANLRKTSACSMWRADLSAFLTAYEAWELEEERQASLLIKQQLAAKKGGAGKAGKGGKAKAKKKITVDSDEDSPSDDNLDDDDDFAFVKPKKAPAPRPPAAKKPPSGPQYAVPVVPIKGGGGRPPLPTLTATTTTTTSASLQRTSSLASNGPAPSADSQPEDSLGPSLMDRLQQMNLKSSKSNASKPRSTSSQQSRGRGRLKAEAPAVAVVDDDSEPEVMSPAPAILKSRAAPVGGAGRGKKSSVAGDVENGDKKAVKRKAAAKKKATLDSGSEDGGNAGEASALYEAPTPSPAIVRKGKNPKVGVSPVAFKTSKLSAQEEGGAAEASRAARARRGAAPKVYCEVSGDDDSDDVIAISDGDSDFALSD